MKLTSGFAALLIATSVVGGGLISGCGSQSGSSNQIQVLEPLKPLKVEQIDKIASEITVLIDTSSSGSGVLIAKERGWFDTTYYVLTAKHVIQGKNEFDIVTPDGERYRRSQNDVVEYLPDADLAVVQFASSKPYALAKLTDWDFQNRSVFFDAREFKDAPWIFISGFPDPKQESEFPKQKRFFSTGTLRNATDSPFSSSDSSLNDPKRCEGLLKDLCGDESREIFFLVSAAKEGIPERLITSQSNMPRELLITNLVERLQNSIGIEEKYALWAVESWALALGVEFPEMTAKPSETLFNKTSKAVPPAEDVRADLPNSPNFNWKLMFGTVATLSIFAYGGIFLFAQNSSVPTERSFTPDPIPSPSVTPSILSPKPTPTVSVSPSISSSPSASASPSIKPTTLSISNIAGEYKVVLDPKVLADAEKEGVKSVTGKWTIKADGTFEATVKAISTKDEVQEIKTTGRITIEDGKVVSQVETVNGDKPPQTPPKQLYTVSADGKELQADGQPVKLVRQ
jgi:hypothetical protein